MTSELAHVLKHELAHSFINKLSGGRCPPWLHEGIAQFLEPRSLGSNGRQLSRLFKAQRNIPMNVLEGSFRRYADRLRITAQLIYVKDQTHLWAEEYDRWSKDLVGLQGEVAVAVAQGKDASERILDRLGNWPRLGATR